MSEGKLNFARQRIEGVDFSDARLHDVNFENVKITDGWLRNADIDGFIGGLRLNGVEVAPFVEAEFARLYPERQKLNATDPAGLAEAWVMIEGVWAETVARARRLPEDKLHERVDGEWSFIETLRHLLLATDCWLIRMVHGKANAYHPWGLGGAWLSDPKSWGLDPEANPSLDEVLSARIEHMAQVEATIDEVTPEELQRVCTPPESPGHPNEPHTVLQCLHVVLEEEWLHNEYAVRDLAILEGQV